MSSAIAERLQACPRNPILNGILGALMGDALGVPHEFKPASHIPLVADIHLVMSPWYPKTYSSIAYGTWSDDGAQLMALAEALSNNQGQLDLDQFGQGLLNWWQAGRHQAGGRVFDIGGQTRAALARLQHGTPAALSGQSEGNRCGNGALMRCIPAALVPKRFGRTDDYAVSAALSQSLVTHGNLLSMVTCGVYAKLALRVASESSSTAIYWPSYAHDAITALRSYVADKPFNAAAELALDTLERFGNEDKPTGSGYAVNCFWSAIAALDAGKDYLSAVRAAIALGNDTDTTACVTGGLAALAWGFDSVPADWWDILVIPPESLEILLKL